MTSSLIAAPRVTTPAGGRGTIHRGAVVPSAQQNQQKQQRRPAAAAASSVIAPSLPRRSHSHHSARLLLALTRTKTTTFTTTTRAAVSGDATTAAVTAVTAESVVRGMYDAINRRDVAGALKFVDDDILYEDFNFPTPFKGIDMVKKLFEESCDGIPDDLLFIIDECTDGGGMSVGMTWYVEIEGQPFPNARGASLYRINPASGKLVYARDVVESPLKLGDVSFSIIRLVAPLVKKQLQEQKKKNAAAGEISGSSSSSSSAAVGGAAAAAGESTGGNNAAAATLYALGAAYWFVLLLSPPGWQGLPGEPAWAVAPETLKGVIDQSTDFFFVLPLLNKAGIDLLGPAPAVHPVTLGVFNFAEAFVFMLLPPLLMDRKGRDLPTVKLWSVAMFLTNALLLPYMALRTATPVPATWEAEKKALGSGGSEGGEGQGLAEVARGEKGLLSKAFGFSGLAVGLVSVAWALAADPEVGGDMAQRGVFLGELLKSDRVSLAFVVDIAVFSAWQAYLIGQLDPKAPAACKYVPFWGLAAWLML
eukprot:CAMPEP_0197592470 /NCGR_PEP_ID=MMETSP1326-20131121/15106_1 /TAXON_ID=1155430 /ORGANISM="Genus nov. species nov., Strain RCC2288" /LENGTH=533 /DNA_ID=CAMNT_0043158169 /DNA_START=51 /DNA_END=1652 /DNA_ORIENTATION=-